MKSVVLIVTGIIIGILLIILVSGLGHITHVIFDPMIKEDVKDCFRMFPMTLNLSITEMRTQCLQEVYDNYEWLNDVNRIWNYSGGFSIIEVLQKDDDNIERKLVYQHINKPFLDTLDRYSICEEVFDRQLKDEPKAVSSSLICHRSLDEAITNYCQNTNMGWGNIESCKEDWTEKIKSFEQLRIDRTPDCEEKFYQEMKMSTTEYFTICIDQGIGIAVDEYCKDNNTGIGNILDCKSELVN